MDGNIEKMQSLTGRIVGLGIDKTLTKKGMCAEAEAVGKALATKVSITDIVDDLLSVASDKPLSANQGRILKKQIDEIDPHYAENVIYKDTNVKDALDKVSKAENIAYDGDKSVQVAIDELKGTIGYSKKNLLPYPYYSGSSIVDSGLTWNCDNNGVLSANGTASNNCWYNVIHASNKPLLLKKGKYILNGCVSGGSNATYRIELLNSNFEVLFTDIGNGCEFTLEEDTNVGLRIYVFSGVKLNNLVFKPMIRLASIEDDTYEPYVPSVDGVVANWTPKGTVYAPQRNYYIKHKNSITIFFMTIPGVLTANNSAISICDDVYKTFGISFFRESFTVGFCLLSGEGGNSTHVGISAKNNTLNIERMGVDTNNNAPCYGQITLVTV
jgi:hypothetical protein